MQPICRQSATVRFSWRARCVETQAYLIREHSSHILCTGHGTLVPTERLLSPEAMSQYVQRALPGTSYDKLVKGATKPKPTLPKEKYVHPILQAAFGSTSDLDDVFWALQGRLSEPNSIVIFKSLLLLHTMFRSESATFVLSYLAGDPAILKLRRIGSNGLNEYSYSKLLPRYAYYLDDRVLAFREIGYDVVIASKRDRFARLRKMSVSNGLFKEIAMIQRVMTSLLKCSFFSDDFHDEITNAALHMTLKDLLAFYMGMNEGVINMLEHYFEMSKSDAERSLELYRRFCFQTENVVAFLNSAKRYSHQLRSSIPHLKHAPLSLANALEEYLHETDFSKHEATLKSGTTGTGGTNSNENPTSVKETSSPSAPTIKEEAMTEQPRKGDSSSKQALQDFFESLEQPNTPFNSAYASYAGFNSQPDWFGMHAMTTGGGAFAMPQMTGNPFGPQPTGIVMPQMTGMNPFASQMPMLPQHTMATTPFDSIFGQMSLNSQGNIPLQPQIQAPPSQPHPQLASQLNTSLNARRTSTMPVMQMQPPRQASVSRNEMPKAAMSSQNTSSMRPQKTGTMNPFSIPSDFDDPKPVVQQPTKPTLNELAMNAWQNKQSSDSFPASVSSQPLQPTHSGGLLGQVASEFTHNAATKLNQSNAPNSTENGSTLFGKGILLSPQGTGVTSNTAMGMQAVGQQTTGQATFPAQSQTQSSQIPASDSFLESFFSSRAPNQKVHSMDPQHNILGVASQNTGVGSLPTSSALQNIPLQPTGLYSRPEFSSRLTGMGTNLNGRTESISLGQGSGLGIGLGSQTTSYVTPGAFDTHNTGVRGINSPNGNFGSVSLAQGSPAAFGSHSMSPMELQSQITGLTGIKPFQPSSAFGASLLSGQTTPGLTHNSESGIKLSTTKQPSVQPQQPTQDLLQL